MADYSDLKRRAQDIRDEVKAGANTANRVGVALEGIVNALEEEDLRATDHSNDIQRLQDETEDLQSMRDAIDSLGTDKADKSALEAINKEVEKKQNKLDNYKEDPSDGSVGIFSQGIVSMRNDSQGGVASVEVYNEEGAEGITPVARMSAEKDNGDSANVEVRGNEVIIGGDSIRINGADLMEAIVNDLGLTTDADVNNRMRSDAHPSADRKTRIYKWKYSDGGSGLGISVAKKTGWGYFQYRMNRHAVEFRDVDNNGSAGNWQSWGGTHVVYDETTHKIGLAMHDGFNLGAMLNFSTAISLPVATTTKDGLMTKEQVAALEDKQERLGVGDGISLKDNIASVIIGLGLAFNGREIVVNYDPMSLTFTSDNRLSVNIGKGLHINPDNQLGVDVGDGLEINHSDKTVQLAQTVRDEIAELNRRIQALEAQI